MPRSDEHDFVTQTFIECTHELSRSELFGYGEADRGRFDFACVLTRDFSRQLVGQTLTHHAAGIDKDLASLLHEPDGELPVYLYAHEARNESRIQEFLHNAREHLPKRVGLLRLYNYPTFDADNEHERKSVQESIRVQILDDLLLNVLFGRLQAVDVDMFLQGTGIHGLLLAALDGIALHGFVNFPSLAKPLDINPSTLRPRVFALFAAGMLEQLAGASIYRATTRARVLLRICNLLLPGQAIGSELGYILQRLDLGTPERVPEALESTELLCIGYGPNEKLIRLVSEAVAAKQFFGALIPGEGYPVDVGGALETAKFIGR